MLQIMRAIGIARKVIYSVLFTYLAWRKSRAEQYWLRLVEVIDFAPLGV